jgi:AraC-like DNA-binding protein
MLPCPYNMSYCLHGRSIYSMSSSEKDFYQWSFQNDELSNTDLNFYLCGEEKCAGGHSYGPAVRDHYLIHCIVSGKGTLQCGGKTYELGSGDGFLICPEYITYYEADKIDPWHYYWVGFNGTSALKILNQSSLSYENPIFHYGGSVHLIENIKAMENIKKYSHKNELARMGYLYLFLSCLAEVNPVKASNNYSPSLAEQYIKSAVSYIEKNCHRDINVNALSAYIGINRKYLYTLFKRILGQTPIEFILKTRMQKACNLLINDHLSVSEISNSIGYKDQFIFSKQFKSIIGESPTKYRQQYINKIK